jgi:gliding motility-associatede transport system auxiliary component
MRRWLGGLWAHSARHAVLLALQIVLGAALFGLLLAVAERHNHRFDLTPTQSYVLSDEAVRVAQGVRVPVRITVFYNSQESGQREEMADLLQQFADASSRISYRLLDLDRSPALAKKYGVGSFNTGVVEAEGRVEPLPGVDEEEITNDLLKLTRHRQRTLCFITGHGEHSPQDASDRTGYSEVAKDLEKEDFSIRTLDVVSAGGVPAACTVVLLPGPSHDFLPGEAEQLGRYLDGGGRILLMVDPGAPPSVLHFLAHYDVEAGPNVVVDERNRFYGADSFMPRVPIFDRGTFGKQLDTAAVFAVARTVEPSGSHDTGLKVRLIALSSPDSWAHVNGGVVPDGKVSFDRATDKPGPLPVAVMVSDRRAASASGAAGTHAAPRVGRMIVFGDSDFASNLYLNLLGNKDLFMSSIGVLSEDNELIAMRHKGLPRSSLSPISLTAWQGRWIFWTGVVLEPATFAALGLLITWRRRRRGGI